MILAKVVPTTTCSLRLPSRAFHISFEGPGRQSAKCSSDMEREKLRVEQTNKRFRVGVPLAVVDTERQSAAGIRVRRVSIADDPDVRHVVRPRDGARVGNGDEHVLEAV